MQIVESADEKRLSTSLALPSALSLVIYLAAVEKNREKACYQYYVTDRCHKILRAPLEWGPYY